MSKLIDTLIAGSPVIMPLLIASLAVLTLGIERCLFWRRARRHQQRVIQNRWQLYQEDRSLAVDKLKQHLDLSFTRVLLSVLSLPNITLEQFRLALDAGTQAELPGLKQFSNIFETSVRLAPLLGLLGTVTGLIRSFSSLTLGDTGDSKTIDVTSGISETLICTAAGLIVAVIALIAATFDQPIEIKNVVPLLDVMFALLTFFVLSTLFLTRTEGLPVNLPQAKSAVQQKTPTHTTSAVNDKAEVFLKKQAPPPASAPSVSEPAPVTPESMPKSLPLLAAPDPVAPSPTSGS